MSEHRPWLWALVSLVIVAAGLGVLSSVPGALTSAREYTSALDDLPERGAVVVGKDSSFGRGGTDWFVTLRVSDRSTRTVEVETKGEWREFDVGDEVLVAYWDAEVTRIGRPGGPVVETTFSPLHDRAVAVTTPFALIPWGGFGLWMAYRFRRSSGSWTTKAVSDEFEPTIAGSVIVGALGAGSFVPLFFVGPSIHAPGRTLLVMVAVAVAGGAVGAAVFYGTQASRRRRRLRSRSGHDAVRRRRRRRGDDPDDDDRDDD